LVHELPPRVSPPSIDNRLSKSTSSTREQHGLFLPRWGTFVAARSRSPSIQKCSELKPPEHSERPTSNLSDGSRRDCPFHSSSLRFLRQCALFATVVAHVMRGIT